MLQNLRFFFRTHRKQLRTAGIFFLLGLAYYIVTQLTPLRIPCLFQKITGLACPGCGISHFCIRLLHLDFLGAARENLAIALLSPLWLAAFLVRVPRENFGRCASFRRSLSENSWDGSSQDAMVRLTNTIPSTTTVTMVFMLFI